MLRRGEIKDLEYGGKRLTVKELLEKGLLSQDPTSLVNNALLISWEGDILNYHVG